MIAKQGIKKVLDGILKYQSASKGVLLPMFRETLDKPAPKSIMLTCVDSQVNTSRMFKAEPSTYFNLRNPGNFIPKNDKVAGVEPGIIGSTSASLELACVYNNCDSVVVVGHSNCKSMNLLYSMRNDMEGKHDDGELKKWLRINGRDTVKKFLEFEKSGFKKVISFSECDTNRFEAIIDPENQYCEKEKFSQINTLEQLKNANNYSFLKDKVDNKKLRGYAVWLDTTSNEVYLFSYIEKRFVKLNENSYEKLYQEAALES